MYRFGPAHGAAARHLFVFLHGSGSTPQAMIPIAFRFQARFPSAALVLPCGGAEAGDRSHDWFSTRGLNESNRQARVADMLPAFEDLVRREQASCGVAPSATALIGFSQGGTVALEAVKADRRLASAVVAYGSRFATLPGSGSRPDSRIHLVHGEFDSVVSRVHAERAARALAHLRVPVTLDIIDHLGHALTHDAISRGSLRLLQGIYEPRRALAEAPRDRSLLH
jgi:phospholipase/carboxylesterase